MADEPAKRPAKKTAAPTAPQPAKRTAAETVANQPAGGGKASSMPSGDTGGDDLPKRLIKIINELEERFAQGTIPLREMTAYVEAQKIPHLDGYLRRAGALDYQSPKRFYQAGQDLKSVRDMLKKNKVPRGLEGLLGAAS